MTTDLVSSPRAPRHPLRLTFASPAPLPAAPKREPLSDLAFFITSFISGFIIIFGMIA